MVPGDGASTEESLENGTASARSKHAETGFWPSESGSATVRLPAGEFSNFRPGEQRHEPV